MRKDMKLLYQFGVIMTVTFLGEVLHAVLPLPVPASIYGLLIMLFCLCAKVIKLNQVKLAADFLIDIMPPMFIPSAVGLITVWKFAGFSYVEHLATSPSVRNKGYGRKIMEVLQQQFPGVIILEVEKPVDEWSRRRIGFYQRCGFSLCEKEYVQPSYRKGGETLPMFLMYAGTETIDKEFESIRNEIYR